MEYKFWFVVRQDRSAIEGQRERHANPGRLAREHAGFLIYSRSKKPLRHADLRIAYEYCPACGRSTKDYGGKKHLYHPFGTLTSDVWKDIAVDPADPFPEPVIARVRDLLAVPPRRRMLCLAVESLEEASRLPLPDPVWEPLFPGAPNPLESPGPLPTRQASPRSPASARARLKNGSLVHGDVLRVLDKLPAGSVDFVFADPPYNLSKRYASYGDSLEARQYFDWCDGWIEALERILLPGGCLSILNLPLWSIRHFLSLNRSMRFRNWIAWDALSQPVRRIMPAHYGIVIFEKAGGGARPAPRGRFLSDTEHRSLHHLGADPGSILEPVEYQYCLRPGCRRRRAAKDRDPRRPLTDLWTDIHRLKHNTQRHDHPCQLPPQFLGRLILTHTRPGDLVLDPFNGVGTTTLCAAALGRRFLGVEIDKRYHEAALTRHFQLERGENPFDKRPPGSIPSVKNNLTPRSSNRGTPVTKRALQLELRRLAAELGRAPTRDEAAERARYPIEYYDSRFRSWSEAVAAARTTGMRDRPDSSGPRLSG
jgi:site-specific DNA-methyltransferase (adenine-specific)